MPGPLLAWQTLRPGLSAWSTVGTQALGGMNEVRTFKSPALRHHLCSLQSSHGAQAGPEAKALESPHCKQNRLCSQVPTESRAHRTLFLPLALEIGATVYLPKVSSHSTSSSIVRSKSSNEGLPSGFYKKSRRSCESQNPFPRKLSRLKSHGTPHRQDSGTGET